jgi:tetratricopeptide (TPR) repeat protein
MRFTIIARMSKRPSLITSISNSLGLAGVFLAFSGLLYAQAETQTQATVAGQNPVPVSARPGGPQNCPDLTPLYSLSASPDWTLQDWDELKSQLLPILPNCLLDTGYFALLGAAQLNTGDLSPALESLERALLLDPDNGGAQIDYAQALYLRGDLFSALAMNRQILSREDLPADLAPSLRQRQQQWRGLTRQTQFEGDLLLGYDNNLNGAPSPSDITLTLSGEDVTLPLNPEFQPKEGPYLNGRLGVRYRQLAPEHQHNVVAELRGRVSDDAASDLLQFDGRYAFIKPDATHSWQAVAGLSHLMFGGTPLYTAAEVGGRYMPGWQLAGCRPYSAGAAQHQLFHNQSSLNAIETKVSIGLNCLRATSIGQQQWTPEFSALYNDPIRNRRSGGSRLGWQFNLDWRLELPDGGPIRGSLMGQINHTEMTDKTGYSPLLENNARRAVRRSYLLLQYNRSLSPATQLLVNFYHQKQRSNLDLFRSVDTTLEFGVTHIF